LKLTQNQFDSLLDLVYNFGIGHFINSKLYQLIKTNPNDLEIKDVFEETGIHDATGKVLKDLQGRRIKEATLYFT
jgi:GH24 family phage-related lysozyme (muramidase)